ncbi:MAG: ABC transporter permease [Solirubrobacteraceae bacterium]
MSAPAQAIAAPRSLDRAGVALCAVALLVGAGFGLSDGAGEETRFRFSAVAADLQLGEIAVPVGLCAWTCAVVVAIVGVRALTARGGRRIRPAAVALAIVAATVAFLCWAAAGKTLNLAGMTTATVTGALPLVLGALAGVLCERSGVINVAIEGQFLLGAFTASVAASLAGAWAGLLAGSLAGGVVGALLALMAIRYLADQLIVGVVLNLVILGLTGFLFSRIVVPDQATLGSPPGLPSLELPGLSELPVIGPALFDQSVMLAVAVVLVIGVQVTLRRTRWGLRTLAVGENPDAAESAGVNVRRVRYRNVIAGGMIAGLGGVYLTIGSVGAFGPNISSGKGFIALAALIFGRWMPIPALVAALVFGFADAVQNTLSIVGTPIPTELLQMFPYLVTILAVAGLVGQVKPPAADGKPFVRG